MQQSSCTPEALHNYRWIACLLGTALLFCAHTAHGMELDYPYTDQELLINPPSDSSSSFCLSLDQKIIDEQHEANQPDIEKAFNDGKYGIRLGILGSLVGIPPAYVPSGVPNNLYVNSSATSTSNHSADKSPNRLPARRPRLSKKDQQLLKRRNKLNNHRETCFKLECLICSSYHNHLSECKRNNCKDCNLRPIKVTIMDPHEVCDMPPPPIKKAGRKTQKTVSLLTYPSGAPERIPPENKMQSIAAALAAFQKPVATQSRRRRTPLKQKNNLINYTDQIPAPKREPLIESNLQTYLHLAAGISYVSLFSSNN